MSVKRTKCENCNSYNIKEVNPEERDKSNSELCNIKCICEDCNNEFIIKSWTSAGRRKGIRY